MIVRDGSRAWSRTSTSFFSNYPSSHRLAASISTCLATLSVVPVPVVTAIIGEGGSGGAMALGVADRILMQENAIYSVIAPEGAAAILYRTAARAHDLAGALKLTAYDCARLGVVDNVVPEPADGAQNDPQYAALQLRNHIHAALGELLRVPTSRLAEARYQKFRRMGQKGPQGRSLLAHEVEELRRHVTRAVEEVRERLPHSPLPSPGQRASEPGMGEGAATDPDPPRPLP